MTDCFIIF